MTTIVSWFCRSGDGTCNRRPGGVSIDVLITITLAAIGRGIVLEQISTPTISVWTKSLNPNACFIWIGLGGVLVVGGGFATVVVIIAPIVVCRWVRSVVDQRLIVRMRLPTVAESPTLCLPAEPRAPVWEALLFIATVDMYLVTLYPTIVAECELSTQKLF